MISALAYYSSYITVAFIAILSLIVVFMFFDTNRQNRKANTLFDQNLPLVNLRRGNDKSDKDMQ